MLTPEIMSGLLSGITANEPLRDKARELTGDATFTFNTTGTKHLTWTTLEDIRTFAAFEGIGKPVHIIIVGPRARQDIAASMGCNHNMLQCAALVYWESSDDSMKNIWYVINCLQNAINTAEAYIGHQGIRVIDCDVDRRLVIFKETEIAIGYAIGIVNFEIGQNFTEDEL